MKAAAVTETHEEQTVKRRKTAKQALSKVDCGRSPEWKQALKDAYLAQSAKTQVIQNKIGGSLQRNRTLLKSMDLDSPRDEPVIREVTKKVALRNSKVANALRLSQSLASQRLAQGRSIIGGFSRFTEASTS
jgi:hypothetical protein